MDKKEKIRSLLTKASDPASSEAEAAACMARAKKMMDETGLTEDECRNASGDDFVFHEWDAKMSKKHGAILHPVDRLCGAEIAHFCGCRMFFTRDPNFGIVKAKFFGLKNDVSSAEWMRSIVIEQFDAAWSDYVYIERKNKSLRSIPDARRSFSAAYCGVIAKRFEDWTFASADDLGGYDNSLVLVKQDLIMRELERRNYKFATRHYAGPAVRDGLAAGAGYNSAQAATLGTGLYHGRPQLTIADKR